MGPPPAGLESCRPKRPAPTSLRPHGATPGPPARAGPRDPPALAPAPSGTTPQFAANGQASWPFWFARRCAAAQLVEEVQQDRQVRGRFIVRKPRSEALAVRRQVVVGDVAN